MCFLSPLGLCFPGGVPIWFCDIYPCRLGRCHSRLTVVFVLTPPLFNYLFLPLHVFRVFPLIPSSLAYAAVTSSAKDLAFTTLKVVGATAKGAVGVGTSLFTFAKEAKSVPGDVRYDHSAFPPPSMLCVRQVARSPSCRRVRTCLLHI